MGDFSICFSEHLTGHPSYFSRDSAKNKFLDLFSALTAPKIRACKAIPIKTLPRREELERILVKDFYLKIIISGQRPYFIKDFLQRFLALAPPQAVRKHNILSISQWTEPLS